MDVIENLDQKDKTNFIIYLIGSICTMDIYTKENLIILAENIEKLCEKIIKRNEQCLLMLNLTKLYYNETNQDIAKVATILEKAKKFAMYAMTQPENAILFVYILNEYIRLDGEIKSFDKNIDIKVIEEIIENIKNYLITMKNEKNDENMISKIENYFDNTMKFIKDIQKKQRKTSKNYKLVEKIKIDN